MIYGYARCSTNESKQDINRQIKELKAAGAEEVILQSRVRFKLQGSLLRNMIQIFLQVLSGLA